MKDQSYGLEIEMTGITREQAAKIVADYFDTVYQHSGGSYDMYTVRDTQSRQWKIMFDSSITPETKHGTADTRHKVEVVSPICKYEDIETIQEIVRKLRGAGGRVNQSCGLHVHINAAPYSANTLRNITNIMASKEDLLYKALQVNVSRENSFCKKTDQNFLEELNRKKPKTLADVSRIWYDGGDGSNVHYHASRYRCLNLHSVFQKGTLEFRLFESSLHAGKVKSYIQLCLAISHQALTQTCASRTKTVTDNPKYTFRTWLLRLGLIGDEFKTARLHLLEHLDGCISWKNPEDAVKQRERIKEQRQAEQLPETIENNEQSITEAEEQDNGFGFNMSM